MRRRLLTVQSLKYDGRVHREWRAELLRAEGSLHIVRGVFEVEVRHTLLGTIQPGTISTEYFWSDRWYSVFRFQEPAGALRNFYCNINTPPRISQRTITFIDLDVDVLVAPDFSATVLDEDEFDAHEKLFHYPSEFRPRVRAALAEILLLLRLGRFPFDEQTNAPTRA